ncbi:uncharacterized protein LOC127837285 [Dreissena polymorpha]|uniref:G-protein coupled receptors family 1 profile domain-containing protein n=1 Tax=Dreissena polymorpha TaxID=45954 RepID=A0A9D4J3D5_DREPO|nr:uncharacterized protein LOC127837285 [Dreissena polymorpha]KAH3798276.1 hypothetical protein DPMN_151873 [Dreissena polymorpha]
MNTSVMESVDTFEPDNFLECQIAPWIWRIVPGFCICVGTIGNLLNVIILKRLNLRRFPRNILLVFLAVSDTTFLWTLALQYVLLALNGYSFLDNSDFLCRTTGFVGYTAGAFSSWVIVLLTMERTLAVRAPVFSRNKLTFKNCILACGVTLTVIAVLNCHLLYGFDYKDYAKGEQVSAEYHGVALMAASNCSFVSTWYMKFYVADWNIITITLYCVIPIVITILGNINIAMVIVSQRRQRANFRTTKNKVPDCDFTMTSIAGISSTDLNDANLKAQNTNSAMVGTINSEKYENQRITDISTSHTKPTRDCSVNEHDLSITKSDCKKKTRQKSQRQFQKHMAGKDKRGQHATRLLFCICTCWILTFIPFAVLQVIRRNIDIDVPPKTACILELTRAVTHSLLYFNFALNFFFYFVSGTLFKNEWKKMVLQTRQALKRLHTC